MFFLLAFIIGDDHGEEAGAVIINIGVELIAIEAVDERCPLLWDMQIAQMFADDGPVFGLTSALSLEWRERDLVNSMNSLWSNRATRLLMYSEPLSTKASQLKGKLFQELFQNGDQVVLADLFHGADDLERSHLIDRVDVVDPFDAV